MRKLRNIEGGIIVKIRQHIPSFFEGFEPVEAEFTTLDELKNIDFVKKVCESPEFIRLSLSDNHILMLELSSSIPVDQKKKIFYVLGYISEGDVSILGLPKFKPIDEDVDE